MKKDKYDNPYLTVGLSSYNLIYECFGVSITEARQLDILTFNRLLRDAICIKLKETEEGRKYLYDCWRYTQTEPDFSAIQKFNNKKD